MHHLFDLLRRDITWGILLAVIGLFSFRIHRGATATQRRSHRIFRGLLVLSCFNFTLACNPGSYTKLEAAAPLINHFLVRWLIASIFLLPAFAVAEIVLMRHTHTSEKTHALITDCSLALVYSVMVAGALIMATMTVAA